LMASDQEHTEVVERLLQTSANPNIVSKSGTCALIEASTGNNIEIVALLLQFGADPLQENDDGRTAVDFTSSDKIIQLLSQYQQPQTGTK
jgi:ankyrin repeat protein